MATSFLSVYSSAIAEIDDPDLTYVFNQNPTSPIQFYKILYQFFQNAWPLFNNPISEIDKLSFQVVPSGAFESFSGGKTNYVLSTTPVVGAYFEFKDSGLVTTGSYNYSTGCAIFSSITSSPTVEWYYPGQFNNDLTQAEISILGKLLDYQWGEKEKNYKSDIRRALMDTDFKMTSEGVIMRGKGDLWLNMRANAYLEMNNFAWSQKLSSYGGRQGFGM